MSNVETTHDCPRDGESVTLCCGKSPFELPRTDRLTVEADLVTCGQGGNPSPVTPEEQQQ